MLLDITDTDFTDNDIYELSIKFKDALDNPSCISNRSFTSFVLFNVPSNETLNATGDGDTDGDSLSDYDELWTYYTNPFLSDTDNDGMSDYAETLTGSDPNNYTNTIPNTLPSITNEQPANESVGESVETNLSVDVEDYEGFTMNVTFYSNYSEWNDDFSSSDVDWANFTSHARMSFQRTTFYAQDLYWVFYKDLYWGVANDNATVYRTSSDGAIWSNAINITEDKSSVHADFSLYTDGIDIHCAWAYIGMDVSYRRGRLSSDGTISWNSSEIVINATIIDERKVDPLIVVDANGSVWLSITTRFEALKYLPVIYKSDGPVDGDTWTNASGFPYNMNDSLENYFAEPVALNDGKLYVFMAYAETGGMVADGGWLYGRLWTGSEWLEQENLTSKYLEADEYASQSFVGIEDDAHIVFIENETQISHLIKNTTSGLVTEYVVNSTLVNADTPPTLTKNNDELICFWGYDDKIYYSRWNYDDATWTSATEWFSVAGLTEREVSSAYEMTNGTIPFIYVECDGDEYIHFNRINVSGGTGYTAIGTNTSVPNGSYSYEGDIFNEYDTTYYWYVTVDDGTDTNTSDTFHFTTEVADFIWISITNESWNLGGSEMNSQYYTNETGITFIADMDNTTVNTDLKLQITGDSADWSAATSGNGPDADTYRLNASTDNWVTEYQIVTASATTISTSIVAGQNETFDLRFDTPTVTSTGVQQTITVTATLVKH